MAEADPARPWHSGPTKLADIANLATPAEAPRTIRFPRAMIAMFQLLRQRSFPGGRAMERGGTIVADKQGNLSLQNIGGLASTAGSFTPDVMLRDPANFTLVGVFHTHPYDRTEGSMNGVAFSGGDVGALILTNTILSVVQSGPRTFVYLKTAQTPRTIDYVAVRDGADADLANRVRSGQTFQQGSRIAAQSRGRTYGLAYYQGHNGVVTRV